MWTSTVTTALETNDLALYPPLIGMSNLDSGLSSIRMVVNQGVDTNVTLFIHYKQPRSRIDLPEALQYAKLSAQVWVRFTC